MACNIQIANDVLNKNQRWYKIRGTDRTQTRIQQKKNPDSHENVNNLPCKNPLKFKYILSNFVQLDSESEKRAGELVCAYEQSTNDWFDKSDLYYMEYLACDDC